MITQTGAQALRTKDTKYTKEERAMKVDARTFIPVRAPCIGGHGVVLLSAQAMWLACVERFHIFVEIVQIGDSSFVTGTRRIWVSTIIMPLHILN